MPTRSSRSSWTTGKQLWPDSRTARATSSACTGMVRATTSTRGVMTSRTSMSRRSASASMISRSCSEAAERPAWRRPGPLGHRLPPGPAASRSGALPWWRIGLSAGGHRAAGQAPGASSARCGRRWRARPAPAPVGRSRRRRCRRPAGPGVARRRRSGSRGFTSQPSAPERRAKKTSGRRSSSMRTGTWAQVAVGLLEPQLEADGHAAHVAHLHVDDDQVDARRGARCQDLGPRRHLDHLDVGAGGDRRDLGPHGRRVAGDQDDGHGTRLPTSAGPGDGGEPGAGPKRWSATAPRPARSCTSCRRSGTRATGAGASSPTRPPRSPPRARPPPLSWVRLSTRAASSLPSGAVDRGHRAERRVDPVDDQPGRGDPGLGQLVGEEGGLVHRVGPGRRHQDVGRGRVGQQLADGGGPGPEALFHALKAWKKATASSTISAPATLEMRAQQGLGGHDRPPGGRPGSAGAGPGRAGSRGSGSAGGGRRGGRGRCGSGGCPPRRCRSRPTR